MKTNTIKVQWKQGSLTKKLELNQYEKVFHYEEVA